MALVMQAPGLPLAAQLTARERPISDHSAPCRAELRDAAAHDAPPCAGTFAVILRNRTFRIPRDVVDGLTIQPTLAFRWSPTAALTLSIDNQTVDNSGPGRQGQFRVSRTVGDSGGSGNFLQETAIAAEFRLLESASQTSALRLQGSISRGVRSYHATNASTGETVGGNRRELVPTAALLFDRWSARTRLSLGPAVAFLPASNALYLRALPDDASSRFGTNAGLRVEGDFRASSLLSLWSGAFFPVSGHNSISRESGRPERSPVWDAGIALHLNPSLDAELFLSNALGNTGALAFVADREYRALGTGIVFRPFARDAIDHGSDETRSAATLPGPMSRAASVVGPPWRVTASLAAGGQGALASVDITPVPALRLGAYLDNSAGIRDEGELGASATMQLIAQSDRMPFSLNGTLTGARTNNVLVNLLSGNRDEFIQRGYSKSGFTFGDESISEGKLYVLTGSLAMQRRLGTSALTWFAPTVAVVQRNGVQLAGISAGLTGHLTSTLSLIAEGGVALSTRGNALTSDGRVRRVPWAIGLVRDITVPGLQSPVALRGYVTNRVGDSPFHALRVRYENRPTLGVGILVPLGGTR